MSTILSLFLIAFVFFLLPFSVSAATTLSVDTLPATIEQSQEFEVDVTFTCTSCTGDSYLRGVLYESGTKYFGYTQDNSGNWSNAGGSSCTTYYKVAKTDLDQDGKWTGKLKFKPDKENAYYEGPGEYLFKIGRYTSSCSSASTWSEEKTIAITGPTATPTPTPTPEPTSTPKPSKTPAPTEVPTKSPTAKPTAKKVVPSVTKKVLTKPTSSVLGSSTKSAEKKAEKTPTPAEQDILVKGSATNIISAVFIMLGGGLIVGCGILIFFRRKKDSHRL